VGNQSREGGLNLEHWNGRGGYSLAMLWFEVRSSVPEFLIRFFRNIMGKSGNQESIGKKKGGLNFGKRENEKDKDNEKDSEAVRGSFQFS
jgi:hypothetical protein